MGNKQGSLGHHLDTASKTGALAFPSKVCNYILRTQDKIKEYFNSKYGPSMVAIDQNQRRH